MERPRGVTVIAILALALGLLGIVSGVAQVANVALIERPLAATPGLLNNSSGGVGAAGDVILGMLTLAFAVAILAFGVGAWLRRWWAWALGVGLQWAVMIEQVILMALDGVTPLRFAVFTLAVAILLYLYGADVRAAFDARARSLT